MKKSFTRAYFQKQGKLGGLKRAQNLTPERRSEIGKLAAQAKKERANGQTHHGSS